MKCEIELNNVKLLHFPCLENYSCFVTFVCHNLSLKTPISTINPTPSLIQKDIINFPSTPNENMQT